MNKTLFLDIDGVLNQHNATSKYDRKSTSEKCVQLVNEVIDIACCDVVIISNWAQDMTFDKLSGLLYSRGIIEGCIVDAIKPTPIGGSMFVLGIEKDKFIFDYITENKIENYAVLDDTLTSEILDTSRLVKPNSFVGITEVERDKLLTILK